MIQIMERMQTTGVTCVPCRCRCNVPVGANQCGLPHALALCYRHHSDIESSCDGCLLPAYDA